MTKDPVYLEVAQLNADYWLAHAPEDGVVPWDFDAPESWAAESAQLDTSAAAIAAVGLFNLAELATNAGRRSAYLDCAVRTMSSLTANYLGDGDDGWEGILRGGVYHIHKDLGVNESVMWGEFFFVEALQKTMSVLRAV